MSPLWGHAIGVGIVLMMLVFCAIWFWAWLPYHKDSFDSLARLPMRDADGEGEGEGDANREDHR